MLCCVLTLPLLAYDSILTDLWLHNLHGNDYGKFYYAVQGWLKGGSLYAPNIATRMQVGGEWRDYLNLNPPHFHLLVWPFVYLPIDVSGYLWLAANIACAAIALALLVRELRIPLRGRWFWPTVAYLLACAPTTTVLITGQFPGMLLLAIALAWLAARRGHDVTAGIWLGVLISVKPFLGLFLPALLIRREWRTLAAACVAGSVCLLVGVAVFGLRSHREWMLALSNVEWAGAGMNGSLEAIIARAFMVSPYYAPVAVAPGLVLPLWIASAGVVLGVTLVSARRSIDHAFASVVLGALLVSPLGWVYYLWLAIPGCLALWRGRMPVSVLVALCALLVPYFAPAVWRQTPTLTLTVGSAYAWATLCLWYATIAAPTPITQPASPR